MMSKPSDRRERGARLTDAEDLMELRKAKRAEGKKKSMPLAQVKKKLGLR